ncbi:hypothetical protein [Bacillus cereus group sp. BfR-BA-01423]|uniref:hypothetical protein n=1 Tax=Bacillus cereus group sp. BfR-BA-01423 TaxID=2920340 RepID=UPI001F59E5D6|nr:hypothetical protein [Bacillus cereus group sp. BfR-BA-01423]
MKLNIPLHKRIHQFFCKHETVGWGCHQKGLNRKEGYEYVTYECGDCGLTVGEWFKAGEWEKFNFPKQYTFQNKRAASKS